MMTELILEYFEHEFDKLIKEEIQQVFQEKEAGIALERYNKTNSEENIPIEVVTNILDTDKHLSKLSNSIAMFKAIYAVAQFEDGEIPSSLDKGLNIIKRNITKSDNKKLWVLLWVLLQQKIIKNKIYSDEEIEGFYIDLFENNYVTIIEEFLEDLSFTMSSFFYKERYFYLLENAVKKYPQIDVFRRSLEFVYFVTKNYKKYLPLINSNIEKVEISLNKGNKICIDSYLSLLSLRLTTYYEMNMLSEALNDIELIRTLLPDMDTLNNEKIREQELSKDWAYFRYYKECVLKSISINIKQNNNELLAKDIAFIYKYMYSDNINEQESIAGIKAKKISEMGKKDIPYILLHDLLKNNFEQYMDLAYLLDYTYNDLGLKTEVSDICKIYINNRIAQIDTFILNYDTYNEELSSYMGVEPCLLTKNEEKFIYLYFKKSSWVDKPLLEEYSLKLSEGFPNIFFDKFLGKDNNFEKELIESMKAAKETSDKSIFEKLVFQRLEIERKTINHFKKAKIIFEEEGFGFCPGFSINPHYIQPFLKKKGILISEFGKIEYAEKNFFNE